MNRRSVLRELFFYFLFLIQSPVILGAQQKCDYFFSNGENGFFTEPENLFLSGGSHKNTQNRSTMRVVSRFKSVTGLLPFYTSH